MSATPTIFNIQRFSTHDGPGIRTTVFFKGCPLRCAWCHNPESQAAAPELMVDTSRCTGCGWCAGACTHGAITVQDGVAVLDRARCVVCGACADFCPQGLREVAGRPAPPAEELVRTLLADRPFFERSGGGVTLSGGEVLAQDAGYIEALCRELRREGVSVALDTCGFAAEEHVRALAPVVDIWLFDIKTTPAAHRRFTGVASEPIWANLAYLLGAEGRAAAPAGARLIVRIPVIVGANASDADVHEIAGRLAALGAREVTLLPYHTSGAQKYARLGRDVADEAFSVPSPELLDHIKTLFAEHGITHVEIGG